MKYSLLALLMSVLVVMSLPAQTGQPIVTVMDFETNGVSENEMLSVISLLSSSLFQTGSFTVIDVAERDTILKEIEFSLTGCTDESCQVEVGKLLSAEMIVTGSLRKVGTKYVLSAKMLETSTSRRVGSTDGIYEDIDSLLGDIYPFSCRLAGIEEPAADVSQAQVEKPDSRKIIGFSVLGAGAVTAGIGGYLLYAAFAFNSETVESSKTAYLAAVEGDDHEALYSDYLSLQEEFSGKLVTAAIITGVGAAAMGASVFFLAPEKEKAPRVSFSVLPAPGAARIAVHVNYQGRR